MPLVANCDGFPEARAGLVRALQSWIYNPNLSGVREEGNLKIIPEPARQAWQVLWADVASIVKEHRKPQH
jgi:hypothetical protein